MQPPISTATRRSAPVSGRAAMGVTAEIIPQPERTETVAAAIELTKIVTVHGSRTSVTAVGIHGAFTIGPYLQGPGLASLGQLAGVGIDGNHRPQGTVRLLTGLCLHIGEGFVAHLGIEVATDGQAIDLRCLGRVAALLVHGVVITGVVVNG